MEGLMTLIPTNEIVGKKKEYKTKEDFVKAVNEEEGEDIIVEDVREGYMRYYPKGTEDSRLEFGVGEGVYMMTDKKTKGVFKVWVV